MMLENPRQEIKDIKQRNIIWLVAFLSFCAMVLCVGSCVALVFYAVNQEKASANADDIVGVWENERVNGGVFRIQAEKYRDHCYIAVQVSDESQTNYPGEIIEEFCYDTGKKNYIGRHIWGGGKSETTEWGEDDGLVIELESYNRMLVRFVDSRYSDGWVFTRVKE